MITSIKLWDYTSTPTVVGTASFGAATTSFEFDDACLKQDYGLTEVNFTSSTITWAGFQLGFMRLHNPQTNRTVALGSFKPAGQWATYPKADTQPAHTSLNTHPPAFKVEIMDGTTSLGFIQMQDGLPVNSPLLDQNRSPHPNPLRPLFNIGMMLHWESAPAAINPKRNNYHPGFLGQGPWHGIKHFSTNPAIPLMDNGNWGRTQCNGLNHFYRMDRLPLGSSYLTTDPTPSPDADPYAYSVRHVFTGGNQYTQSAWATGWQYEPASISGHDWYVGPGGPRYDRGITNEWAARLYTDSGYARPKDNAPILTLVNNFNRAQFNHSGHWVNNLSTFASPIAQYNGGFIDAYYGGFQGPSANGVDMHAINNGGYQGQGNEADQLDNTGNRIWGGWLIDDLHCYQFFQHGLFTTLAFESVISARNAYWWSIFGRLSNTPLYIRNGADSGEGRSGTNAMTRVQAYRWAHHVLAWKTSISGSAAQLGLNRTAIMNEFVKEIEEFHDFVVVPVNANNTNCYHIGMKNLGMGLWIANPSPGVYGLDFEGGPLVFYYAQTLAMMKTTGIWQELLTKGSKVVTALAWLIEKLDKFSVDFFLDTNGQIEGRSWLGVDFPTLLAAQQAAQSITGWATMNSLAPPVGQASWIKNSSGGREEKDVAQHMRAQYLTMRRDYFPEYPNPRLAAAITKVQAWYDEWEAPITAAATPTDKYNLSWAWRHHKDTLLKSPADNGFTVSPTGVLSCSTCCTPPTITTTGTISFGGVSGTANSFVSQVLPTISPASPASTFSVPSGTPTWIVSNTTNGAISITSGAVVGTYTVVQTISNGCLPDVTRTVTITITAALVAPTFTSAPLTITANQGTAASSSAPTTTGTAPITYSLSGQPAGVTVNSTTGVVTVGATTAFGSGTFQLVASNGTLPNATQTVTYTVSAVAVAPDVQGPLPVATAGQPYSAILNTTGSPTTIAVTPNWLSVAFTGGQWVLSGTPPASAAGTIPTVSFSMTNSASSTPVVRTLPLQVNVATSLAITTPNNWSGVHGQVNTFTHVAAGGTPPYTWSISNQEAGVTISSATGQVTLPSSLT